MAKLRKQARELQSRVRAGDREALSAAGLAEADPDYPLRLAQLVTARSYGFASWARLHRHVDTIHAQTWVRTEPPADESISDRFVRQACLTWTHGAADQLGEARALAAAHPGLSGQSIAAAAACAEVAAVARHLASDRTAASAPSGPYGWTPLMYLAYSRMPAGLGETLRTARLLLDARADPNDGRFFLGLPIPFTVLTGVLGGGENGEPPHSHCLPLARVLLSYGADPNDGQALYNRMFGTDDDFLELLFEFGLGQGDGGPWHRRLPDLLDPPRAMVRSLLSWAVLHDQRSRVGLLAEHGVDITAPFAAGDPWTAGATPIEVAVANGHSDLARQLRQLGVAEPRLGPVEAFVGAVLAGDESAIERAPAEVIGAAQRTRPGLIVWAAGQQRLAAVDRLARAGWDVNAFGRSDIPVEQPWHTALHAAVEQGDPALVLRLLELGADRELLDARFNATPAEWAEHLCRDDLVPLLRP